MFTRQVRSHRLFCYFSILLFFMVCGSLRPSTLICARKNMTPLTRTNRNYTFYDYKKNYVVTEPCNRFLTSWARSFRFYFDALAIAVVLCNSCCCLCWFQPLFFFPKGNRNRYAEFWSTKIIEASTEKKLDVEYNIFILTGYQFDHLIFSILNYGS